MIDSCIVCAGRQGRRKEGMPHGMFESVKDPYLYPHTDIMKNLADIRNREMLSCMEAEYRSIRLAELVTGESVSRFDFAALCDMHHYIFQDIYD